MKVVEVPLDSIRVGPRRPLADLTALKDSICDVGLLNPITVTPGAGGKPHILIAGYHRLEACRELGWEIIPAVLCEPEEATDETITLLWELAEVDENLVRNDLTLLPRGEELVRRKRITTALGQVVTHGGDRRSESSGNNSHLKSFAEDTAEKTGVSASTVRQEVQIAERIVPEVKDVIRGTDLADSKTDLLTLARLKPEEQRQVAEVLKSTPIETVKQAVLHLRRETRRSDFAQTSAVTIDGLYACIVIDPPWPYECRHEDSSHRARNPYHTMQLPEIAALEVPAAADCILWLWTTNAFMRDAWEIAAGWGFEVKTILTWAKDKMGLGDWLRGKTEHCLLCVKGRPVVNLTNETTLLEAPAREHSRKPDLFFDMLDKLCYGRKLEMFARTRREGWDSHGDQLDKF